jgi:hypothetical protein
MRGLLEREHFHLKASACETFDIRDNLGFSERL